MNSVTFSLGVDFYAKQLRTLRDTLASALGSLRDSERNALRRVVAELVRGNLLIPIRRSPAMIFRSIDHLNGAVTPPANTHGHIPLVTLVSLWLNDRLGDAVAP